MMDSFGQGTLALRQLSSRRASQYERATKADHLHHESHDRLQRLRFVEHRSTSCPGRGPDHPSFELELKGASERPLPMPRCSCGSDVGCIHVLAAIDLTLSRIVDPLRATDTAAADMSSGMPVSSGSSASTFAGSAC